MYIRVVRFIPIRIEKNPPFDHAVKWKIFGLMKGINTPGQALDPRHFVPPFRLKGRGISTLRSRHSLGNGTNKLVPLLSLRLGIKILLLNRSEDVQ